MEIPGMSIQWRNPNMKRFLFSKAFPIGVAALVRLAIIAPAGYPQTVTSADGSVLVVGRSPLDQRLGHDVATKGTSVVTLDTPRGVVPQRSSNGADESSAVQQAGAEHSIATVKIESTPSHGAGTVQKYFITDLGTLGGTQSFAYALNDFGQVVGQSSITGDVSNHSFLYSNGKMTDLYPLNSQNLQTVGPTGINNAGQITSGVVVDGVYVPAILDSTTGKLTLIGTLGGVTSYGFNGVATSISNKGNAVGYSYIDSINRHAFLYSNNVITDIGSFGGYSAGLAVNDDGEIVGFASDKYNGVAHAFVYTDGVMTDIHPATESYANDDNSQGQVVGQFLTADQTAFHAFLYNQGNFTDLGLAGSGETNAYAINEQGQIVGITFIANKQHAFIYENGRIVDLNGLIQQDSGWELAWAFDVNNHGQIVGYGLVNDKFRAFLLTPAISHGQCKDDGWKSFGFENQGQCIQFVNTGK
jgi:probable HAF family extracellular repeat protein